MESIKDIFDRLMVYGNAKWQQQVWDYAFYLHIL